MKIRLIFLILIIPVNLLAQTEILYLNKQWEKTNESKVFFVRKIQKIGDSFSVNDSSVDCKFRKYGFYKSINPEVEDGQFTYIFYNINEKYIGNYKNGEMVGMWIKSDTKGKPIDTLNYDLKLNKSENELSQNEFIIIEKPAQFKSGIKDFYEFISNNISYPPRPYLYNIQGKVLVQFLVDPQGDLKNIKILKSLDKDLDKEALRVLSLSPKWIPAEFQGSKVPMIMVIPISYKL